MCALLQLGTQEAKCDASSPYASLVQFDQCIRVPHSIALGVEFCWLIAVQRKC